MDHSSLLIEEKVYTATGNNTNDWLNAFRNWVLNWVPTSVLSWINHLSIYVQFVLCYAVVLILVRSSIYTTRRLVSFALNCTAWLAKEISSQLPLELIPFTAPTFVRLDACARAVDPYPYDRKIYFMVTSPGITVVPRSSQASAPWPMHPALYGLRVSAVFFGGILAGTLFFATEFVRWLTRLRIVNMLVVLVVIDLSGLAGPAFKLLSKLHVSNVSLSTMLTIGSLITLVYVLANSDVRGRAESNKNASVQCRNVLHSNTKSMLAMANTLRSLRLAAKRRLEHFPTMSEVNELVSRQDLGWRSGYILPVDANLFPHPIRFYYPFNRATFQECITEFIGPRYQLWWEDSSRLESDELAELINFITDTAEELESHIDELYTLGIAIKLEPVLGLIGSGLMSALRYEHFGTHAIDEIRKIGSPEWLTHLLGESQVEAIRARWVNLEHVSPDSSALRSECRTLTHTLRYVLRRIHEVYWDAAVTENRLMRLSARIDRTLEPPALERIRQFFGK